jgi:FKBP-type peptidyl-prolyl cis-trans isomerase SlyD
MPDKTLRVADDMVVSLHYTLRLDDGEVIDSSSSQEPLAYLQGHGQIISGLEQELYGLVVGDVKNVIVAPSDGYGEVDQEAFQLVSHDLFPDDMSLEEGMGLRMRDVNTGQPVEATITEIRQDGVMLDLNHPLAGETLHFRVKIEALRQATKEELSHGHAH